MRENLRGSLWRFAIYAAVCLCAVALVFLIFGQFRFQDEKVYNAHFANVSGLRNGNFVRIAGVEVGKVKKIALQPDSTLHVEFSVTPSAVLTEGTRAVIRYDDLIGGRFLALEEGAGGVKRLRPGDTIPLSQTEPALDLDALIGGFRPLFRALNPDQVNALSGQLIAAFQGQGATISSFLEPGRRVDQHPGRPGSADRSGHHQPEYRAGIAWAAKASSSPRPSTRSRSW